MHFVVQEECLKLLLDRGANTSPRAFTMIAFSGTGTGSVNATVRASQLAGQRVILDGGVSVGTTWPDFVARNVDLAVIVLPLLLRPQRPSGGSDQPLMLDPNYVEAAATARPLLCECFSMCIFRLVRRESYNGVSLTNIVRASKPAVFRLRVHV